MSQHVKRAAAEHSSMFWKCALISSCKVTFTMCAWTLDSAGQWRYASNKLKTIWSKQHTGSSRHLTAKAAAPAEQEEAEQASKAGALEAAAATEAEKQGPVDASGRAVLLKSPEDLSDAFWKDSKKGKGLLQEVRRS